MPHAWRVLGICIGVLVAAQPTLAVAQDHLQRATINTLALTYSTPKAVAALLHKDFTFTRDEALFGEVDHWQTPQEFLSRQQGDCEDFAILATALLRRLGYEAYIFSLIGDGGYAHTVCIFKDTDGRYNVINQDKIRYYHAASLEEVATQMYTAWRYGGIAEQAGTRGRLVKRIVNLHPALVWSGPAAFPAF